MKSYYFAFGKFILDNYNIGKLHNECVEHLKRNRNKDYTYYRSLQQSFNEYYFNSSLNTDDNILNELRNIGFRVSGIYLNNLKRKASIPKIVFSFSFNNENVYRSHYHYTDIECYPEGQTSVILGAFNDKNHNSILNLTPELLKSLHHKLQLFEEFMIEKDYMKDAKDFYKAPIEELDEFLQTEKMIEELNTEEVVDFGEE